MRWSIGRGKYGNVEEVLNGEWQDFVELLADTATVPRTREGKDTWWWVAPFISRNGNRHNDDIESMECWFAGDLDERGWDVDRLSYRLFPNKFLIYETTSSRPDHQRWRIMIKLSRGYDVSEHVRIWHWFNVKFDGQLCPGTKNPSRIFFLPAAWDHEPPSFHSCYGQPVDVDSVLSMVRPEHVEPPICGVPEGALRPAPDGTPIITGAILRGFLGAPEGLRLYRIMCAAAKRFRLRGWTLDAKSLGDAGLRASAMFAPGKARPDIYREAQRAINWAAKNFSPESPLEAMRNRIRWEQNRALRSIDGA